MAMAALIMASSETEHIVVGVCISGIVPLVTNKSEPGWDTFTGPAQGHCSGTANLSLDAFAVGWPRLRFGPFAAFRKPVARPHHQAEHFSVGFSSNPCDSTAFGETLARLERLPV